ncbi:MAG: OmpH family outer membrane protein [Spirochaetota bacterium]
MGEKSESKPAEAAAGKFRFVNLDIIFNYMNNNDPDSRALNRRKEDIVHKLDDIANRLADAKDDVVKKDLIEKQKQFKQEFAKIKSDEEQFKSIMLNRVNTALGNIAKKSDIDFVFNIGEGAVYAKKEYDITEEVLREIIRQKERSAPVSR